MFTRILTDLERKRLRSYLKADGERGSVVRSLASRARRYLPQLEQDLQLIKDLLDTYDREKSKG